MDNIAQSLALIAVTPFIHKTVEDDFLEELKNSPEDIKSNPIELLKIQDKLIK